MNPSPKFWDRIADRYARKPVADEAAYQKKLATTQTYFRPDMEVLEIGCGTGSTAIAHAPHVRHIRATDISGRMLEIAGEKADLAGIENVTFERASFEELSGPDGSAEAILALSLLHLLEDRDAAIARIFRMLKPGGIFVSNTVCLGDGMRWFALIAPIGRALGFFPLVRVFSADDLLASLTDAGFEVDHEWRPPDGRSIFVVARKPG